MKIIIKARRIAMPRCIILTPLYAGEELPWIAPQPGDFLICADGGWARAAVRADAAAGCRGF